MSLRKLKIKHNARVTGYQEITLSSGKVILNISLHRLKEIYIKDKKIYFVLDIKTINSEDIITIVLDEYEYESFGHMCCVS